MWRVIEMRLRSRLGLFAMLYLCCWSLAVIIALAVPPLLPPERLAVLAGAISLVVAFLVHTGVLSYDARESRAALHFALPLPLGQLIGQRVFEPMLPTVAFGLASLGLGVAGRLLVRGPIEAEPLVFGVAIILLMLSFGQVHLFVDEIQRHVRLRLLIVLGVVVSIAACGFILGYVMSAFAKAEPGEVPTVVRLLSRGEVMLSLLAITALLAGLNRLLMARRVCFID